VPSHLPASRRLVGRSLVGTIAVMIGISFAPANAAPPAVPAPLAGVWWEDGPAGGPSDAPSGLLRIRE
jgi:hypothetical protein